MKKLFLLLFLANYSFAEELTYVCEGLSHFELVGASGAKEEQQSREYKFKNFASAMHFSNEVAELAEMHNHHPLIMTEWGKVTLHWWTHTAKGIAALDLKLANLCNTLGNS